MSAATTSSAAVNHTSWRVSASIARVSSDRSDPSPRTTTTSSVDSRRRDFRVAPGRLRRA
ncbi:MAG TPA: hypothetical protein VN635_08295 [Conexibacter sp.]|nr:hypothetical protein [Conexibacter sp.]